MNDNFDQITKPGEVLAGTIKPAETKRDVPTLLEMIDDLNGALLINQTDLETCSLDDFKSACRFIQWHYAQSLGFGLGAEPQKPAFIEVVR